MVRRHRLVVSSHTEASIGDSQQWPRMRQCVAQWKIMLGWFRSAAAASTMSPSQAPTAYDDAIVDWFCRAISVHFELHIVTIMDRWET